MADDKPSLSTATPTQPMAPLGLPRRAGAWVFGGFLGFGSILGLITGASETTGIGQTLLTGLLGFVGGGALSLVSFVFKRDERPQIRAIVTGQGLVGLALGVWLGLTCGIGARLKFESYEDKRLEALDKARHAQVSTSVAAKAVAIQPPASCNPSDVATPASATQADPEGHVVAALRETSSKSQRRQLLHSDEDSCESLRSRMEQRDKIGYYTNNPGARNADAVALSRCH